MAGDEVLATAPGRWLAAALQRWQQQMDRQPLQRRCVQQPQPLQCRCELQPKVLHHCHGMLLLTWLLHSYLVLQEQQRPQLQPLHPCLLLHLLWLLHFCDVLQLTWPLHGHWLLRRQCAPQQPRY